MYIKATPSLGYSSYNNPRNVTRACFQSLAHVQFGQMVQNSVVSVILGKFTYLSVLAGILRDKTMDGCINWLLYIPNNN